MATTVWAWREGNYNNVSPEWTYSVEFGSSSGLDDLLDKLAKLNLHGRCERLAIVAHGTQGGVYINGLQGLPLKAEAFRCLLAYVPHGGMLEFVGCNVGESSGGDLFLGTLSKLLPNRIIVGYDCYGVFSPLPSAPGQVQPRVEGGAAAETGSLTPWNNHAKWVYNFKLVRIPSREQKVSKNKACINPGCRGHAKETERCPYVNWGSEARVKRWSP